MGDPLPPSGREATLAAGPLTLRDKLAAGRFLVSVEIDPPVGLDARRALRAAALMKEAGADAVNVGDSPTARVRMSPWALCLLIQREEGIETVMHYTTRDRNAMAIHSDMVGCHALGVRNILCLRGDPPELGGYKDVIGVWDVSAVGLIRILKLLNEGLDWTGRPIGRQASFLIGAACNPNADPLGPEIRLMRRKVEAGAHFFVSQNVFDPDRLERFLEQAAPFKRPIIVGILPLHSYEHAQRLHEEVPGMYIPEEVRERLRRAGPDAPQEGKAIAREVMELCRGRAAGVYLVPTYGNYELVAELVAEGKG
jgi:5,10-methylenetetrahydrofolate reductase